MGQAVARAFCAHGSAGTQRFQSHAHQSPEACKRHLWLRPCDRMGSGEACCHSFCARMGLKEARCKCEALLVLAPGLDELLRHVDIVPRGKEVTIIIRVRYREADVVRVELQVEPRGSLHGWRPYRIDCHRFHSLG